MVHKDKNGQTNSINQVRYGCALGALHTVGAIPGAMPITHCGPGCVDKQYMSLNFYNGFQGGGYAAAPVCSPTRAALVTGRHPARVKVTNFIGGVRRGGLLPAAYLRALPASEVTVGERTVTGRLKTPDAHGKTVLVANRVDPETAERLARFGVPYSRVVESTLVRDLLSWIVPALVFFGLWFFLVRRLAERQGGLGGFMSVGKSRAKVYVERDTGVDFSDVAGVDEAKAELQEIVAFLKDPQGHSRLGARMPRGVLLVGPPGTG